MTDSSILSIKLDFIYSQVSNLSNLPQPPENWQEQLPPADEHGDLSAQVIQQVFYKLNMILQKHQKLVYSSQAMRHVAEQIDTLYKELIEGGEGIPAREEDVLRGGVDLKDPVNIDALPESFPLDLGDKASEEDLERYQILRERLIHNAELLRAQRQKYAYYKRLWEMIEPFANPQESVQPNLLTSTGRMHTELDKMRILMSRVTSQIHHTQGRLPEATPVEEGEIRTESFDNEGLKKLLD